MIPTKLISLTTFCLLICICLPAIAGKRVFLQTTPENTTTTTPPNGLVPCLKAINLNLLTLPGDEFWDDLKKVYSPRYDNNSILGIASVASEHDIRLVLRCARTAGVPAVARCGGHSFEGFSVLNGSVVIDLRPYMARVRVLKGTDLILAQGGAKVGEVYYTAWVDASMGFSAGTHPVVGISGLTLGGGFGFLSRREGLTCDRLVSLRMVTYSGEVIIANATHNEDLFWASCGGGGGNFGIVTEWTFRMSAVPQLVEHAQFLFADNLTLPMWKFYQTWAPDKAPPELGMSFKPQRNPGFIEMYYIRKNSSEQGPGLADVIAQSGLLDVDPSLTIPLIENMTWIEAVLSMSGWGLTDIEDLLYATQPGPFRKEKSFYLTQPLSDDGILAISQLLVKKNKTYTGGGLQMHPYGGAVASKSNDATAFPFRQGVLGLIQAQAVWKKPEDQALAEDWLHQLQSIITGEMPHYGYVNYLDLEPADDWRRVYYAGNYDKLVRIKNKYDRANFFTFPQSIGSSSDAVVE